jgi:coenzyme F420-reducing hydrogenase beta subunit/predicted ester cyclase
MISPEDIVRSGLCIGCGSCAAQAGAAAHLKLDRYGNYKPFGPPEWFAGRSASFARTCPFSPAAQDEDELARALFPDAEHHDPLIGRFQTAYVGYAAAETFRDDASSGGLTSWVLTELLRKGLVDGVAHVVPADDPQREGKFFRYRISRTEEEVRAGAKSRYYPVELSDALETIRSVPGRYAVTGIPCFVKAVQLLRRENPVVRERVAFTVGLFCGHMKSARLVESFAWQMRVPVDEIESVEFRFKDPRRPANWYRVSLTLRDGRCAHKDWSDLADGDWGGGFFQNSACNFCDDVVAETADISFGDAWVEPYSSDGRGTNVVIVRSPVLQELVVAGIRERRLKLNPVDKHFVRKTQAATLRHRREGLAYRLSWPRRGLRPRKRVAPDARTLSIRRKLIYRMRSLITTWSHRMFWVARLLDRPQIYIGWARVALTAYQALAYSRGTPCWTKRARRGASDALTRAVRVPREHRAHRAPRLCAPAAGIARRGRAHRNRREEGSMSEQEGSQEQSQQASEEQNKQSVQRLLDEAFSQGNLGVVDEVTSQESVGHDPAQPADTQGPAETRETIAGYRDAFPDLEVSIAAQYADGDVVITSWIATGTQEGELWGIEPTGRQATISGITIDLFDDGGMIMESWTNWDTLGLLQQLGAIEAREEQAS